MALPDAQILIVEDDEEIARLVRDLLMREGFRVETAGDSDAMRVAMARFAPDLIILDLMLPGEDGLSICRNLRARGAFSGPDADRQERRYRSCARPGNGRGRLSDQAIQPP